MDSDEFDRSQPLSEGEGDRGGAPTKGASGGDQGASKSLVGDLVQQLRHERYGPDPNVDGTLPTSTGAAASEQRGFFGFGPAQQLRRQPDYSEPLNDHDDGYYDDGARKQAFAANASGPPLRRRHSEPTMFSSNELNDTEMSSSPPGEGEIVKREAKRRHSNPDMFDYDALMDLERDLDVDDADDEDDVDDDEVIASALLAAGVHPDLCPASQRVGAPPGQQQTHAQQMQQQHSQDGAVDRELLSQQTDRLVQASVDEIRRMMGGTPHSSCDSDDDYDDEPYQRRLGRPASATAEIVTVAQQIRRMSNGSSQYGAAAMQQRPLSERSCGSPGGGAGANSSARVQSALGQFDLDPISAIGGGEALMAADYAAAAQQIRRMSSGSAEASNCAATAADYAAVAQQIRRMSNGSAAGHDAATAMRRLSDGSAGHRGAAAMRRMSNGSSTSARLQAAVLAGGFDLENVAVGGEGGFDIDFDSAMRRNSLASVCSSAAGQQAMRRNSLASVCSSVAGQQAMRRNSLASVCSGMADQQAMRRNSLASVCSNGLPEGGGIIDPCDMDQLFEVDVPQRVMSLSSSSAIPTEKVGSSGTPQQQRQQQGLQFQAQAQASRTESSDQDPSLQGQKEQVHRQSQQQHHHPQVQAQGQAQAPRTKSSTQDPSLQVQKEQAQLQSQRHVQRINDFWSAREKFCMSMLQSHDSQRELQIWDRKMGLKRSHSATMTKTCLTRRQLREMLMGKITTEDDGDEQNKDDDPTEGKKGAKGRGGKGRRGRKKKDGANGGSAKPRRPRSVKQQFDLADERAVPRRSSMCSAASSKNGGKKKKEKAPRRASGQQAFQKQGRRRSSASSLGSLMGKMDLEELEAIVGDDI